MEFKKTITIENPPYKYTSSKGQDYYLTANVFFIRDQWTKQKIMNECKRFLKPHFEDIPKLVKLKLCIDVHSFKTGFDLDNKAYFWRKILLDLLKTPTSKQLKKSYLKGNDVITVEVLPDDTVQYIDDERSRYFHGGSKLVFHLKGKLLDVQGKLL